MKTIKLSELKNMARIMAEASLKATGEYYYIIEGVKTKVIL